MRLREVELHEPPVAFLRWQTTEHLLEKGKGTLVFRDFESHECMLLDYLNAVCETENVSVLCCNWVLASELPKAADVDDQVRVDIEEMEEKLQKLERELAQICALQNEPPDPSADSVDDEVVTQDDSMSDDGERTTAARQEKMRVEKLRSQKYNEVHIARERLATIREQYNKLAPPIEALTNTPDTSDSYRQELTRVIKLTYYNPTGVSEATFLVSTQWRNVDWSRSFIAAIPSFDATSSQCSEVLSITQSTGVDWNNCSIRAVGWEVPPISGYPRSSKGPGIVFRPASLIRADCACSVPFTHYFGPVDVAVRLEEHVSLSERTQVMWNVRFKLEETAPLPDSLKFELHIAGRSAGIFKATRSYRCQEYTHEICDVMEDNNVTAELIRLPDIDMSLAQYWHLPKFYGPNAFKVKFTNIGKSRTVSLKVEGCNLQAKGPKEYVITIPPGSTNSCGLIGLCWWDRLS